MVGEIANNLDNIYKTASISSFIMKKHYIIFITAFFIILFDQLTKVIVEDMPFIVKNTGAVFGILTGQTDMLIWISFFVIGGIFFYYDKIPENKFVLLSVGLILGGTIGNLIDRIRLGYVIDFIDLKFWPSFNIADSAVSVGAVILIIYLMKNK